jgi:hypothetical protein
MNDDFVAQKSFEAFVDAAKRFRWFILITILLSSLQLAHLYIENGFTNAQTHRVARRQILGDKHEDNKKYKDLLAEIEKANDLKKEGFKDKINEAAEYKVQFQMGDNMLKDAKVNDRTIPLLQFIVPGNDFVFILGFMLAIFCVAVWLSSRSVLASLKSLEREIKSNPSVRSLVRLNFLFTGSPKNDWIARSIQYIAIWSSFLCFGITSVIDYYPFFRDIDLELLRSILMRLALVVIFLLIIVSFSIMTTHISLEIHSLVETTPTNSAPSVSVQV